MSAAADHGGANHGTANHGAADYRAIDAREAGARVEALLADLRARCGPEAADVAEELVTCLVRLYGAGLEAILRVADGTAPGDTERFHALLIADPLIESLLLVHDLHPLAPDARIRRALGRLGTGVEFLGIDSAGVAQLRLGHGCGSSSADVERAVTDAAPEITAVRFAPREAPLLQITRRPAGAL